VVRAAIDAGAKSVNIPDTVGYTVPQEFEEVIRFLIKKIRNSENRFSFPSTATMI